MTIIVVKLAFAKSLCAKRHHPSMSNYRDMTLIQKMSKIIVHEYCKMKVTKRQPLERASSYRKYLISSLASVCWFRMPS